LFESRGIQVECLYDEKTRECADKGPKPDEEIGNFRLCCLAMPEEVGNRSGQAADSRTREVRIYVIIKIEVQH